MLTFVSRKEQEYEQEKQLGAVAPTGERRA